MGYFNPAHKQILDALLLGQPLLRPGKMFGYPGYFVGKKLCICIYENGVGIKLSEQSVKKLLENDSNAIPFQPLGKPTMREWVQINTNRSEDYRLYMPIFEESIHFVDNLQSDPKL